MESRSSFGIRSLRHGLAMLLLPAAMLAQVRTGTVSGRVLSGGEGVSGATVVASGTGRGTQARPDGTYRLALPAGRYEIRARMPGFTAARDSVTVTAGAHLDPQLHPRPRCGHPWRRRDPRYAR